MHRGFGTLPCPLRIGWGSAPIIDLWCSRWPALLPQSQEESITLWGLHQRTEGGDPDPRSNRTLHLKKKNNKIYVLVNMWLAFAACQQSDHVFVPGLPRLCLSINTKPADFLGLGLELSLTSERQHSDCSIPALISHTALNPHRCSRKSRK